jgi:hypothetical protein
LLATQNPVDLDYKALSNIGTWFLGRLQTERDKMRVLDGLEGAAGTQNAKFDRASMERFISGLGNRVFLMNNVHESGPMVFHVRWVMSYLTGPLTRGQIKTLMDPKRAEFAVQSAPAVADVAPNPMAMPQSVAPVAQKSAARPAVGAGVLELFVSAAGGGEDIVYRPHLLRQGTVHFSSAKAGVDGSRTINLVNPIGAQGIDWESNVDVALSVLSPDPASGAGFEELPGFAMNAANYKQVEKDFAEWMYRNERADVFSCLALKAWSKLGESEADFRARLAHQAREARDAAVEKVRAVATKKISALETRLRGAEVQLAKEKAEANAAKMQAGVSMLGGLLGGLLGRKAGLGTLTRGSTAIGKASSAYKQHQDVANADAKVAGIAGELQTLQAEMEEEISKISGSYDPAALVLETESIKPTKTDVKVGKVALLWLPYGSRGDEAW